MRVIEGRTFVFGDDINTDVMAPGLYFKASMDEMARHCLEAVDPAFAGAVRSGDILVAGRNFGVGSAREQAAQVLKHLGVGAVLARSFGRIFYRNALNFGLPALVFPAAGAMRPGIRLRVEPMTGRIEDVASEQAWNCQGIPPHLMEMVTAGGLMPWLKQRLAKEQPA